MLTQLRTITPPSALVVDLDTLARHGRLDSDAERDLLGLYLAASTATVEKYLGRSLLAQSLAWTISQQTHATTAWPYAYAPLVAAPLAYDWSLRIQGGAIIELPYSPVQAVTEVSVGHWGEVDTVLAEGADYALDTRLDPARLRLDPSWSWGNYNHLTIVYSAGYATPEAVPAPLRHAVMMLTLNLYEHRGDEAGGGLTTAMKSLLNPYRLVTYAG